MDTPLQRASVPEQVFRRLAADLLTGRYAVGERLPGQRALAAELGVNMATVREGVKRLEQLGLVAVRQGDGMRVLDWRWHGGLDVLAHALGRRVPLDASLVRGVMEARRLLLVEAARLAAARRTPAQAAGLAALAAQIGETVDDATAQALDAAFHAALVEAADNVVFLLIANSIRAVSAERLELFRALVADRGELVPLYVRAAAAVQASDAAAAASAAEALSRGQEARLLEALA